MAEYNNLNNIPAKIVKTSQLPDGVPYYVIGIQSNPLTTVKYPIDQFAATVANLVPNVVKTDQVYANPTWLGSLSWNKIIERPNSLIGYGITDPIVLSSGSYSDPSWITSLAWSKITGAPSFVTSLAALTDVQLTSEVPEQLLKYNGTKWINWTPNFLTGITGTQVTSALGYTPVTNARTLTINGVTYDLTANRSWTISTATPTLDAVTTVGNTTTNPISVGELTVTTNNVKFPNIASLETTSMIYFDTSTGKLTYGAKPVTQLEKRSDYVGTTSYCGTAPLGSAESATVWKIKKIVVASDGSTTTTTATNVAWTDRLTATYI